ncbi:MAG: cell division topological specificity factor MinE [Moraxellaceae bacterium]|nr:cell division topological specificity factor MinE [Moraxellaceae bacterium]
MAKKRKGFWAYLFGSNENKSGSAEKAKERLRVIVASDHRALNGRLTSERIEQMRREILQVVNKYVSGLEMNDVNINHRKEDDIDLLEMSINLPEKQKVAL